MWYEWYLACYGVLTAVLISLKLAKVGCVRRGAVKMAASLMFVSAGLIGTLAAQSGSVLSWLLFVGLCFASLGDLMFIFRKKSVCFTVGVICFCCASSIFSVYSLVHYGWAWWSVFPYAAFLTMNVLAQKFKVYSYGSNKLWLNIYTCTVGLCGFLGLSLFCKGIADLGMFFFGLGCFCYFTSDIFFGLYMFKLRNRFVDAVNTMLYFPGLLFIAVSLWV